MIRLVLQMDHQRETTRHQDTRAASRLGWLAPAA
jgi:hypothetical protein